MMPYFFKKSLPHANKKITSEKPNRHHNFTKLISIITDRKKHQFEFGNPVHKYVVTHAFR